MDMTTSVRGGKWFLLGLLLLCISAGFAEEDGKNNTASKGFPNIKSMAKSFSNTVDSFFKKTIAVFTGSHPQQNNIESTTSSPTNEIKNTTMGVEPVFPVNRTLPGKIEEKPDKVADNKSNVNDGNSTTVP